MKRREFFGLVVDEIQTAKKKKAAIDEMVAKAQKIVDSPKMYTKEYIKQASEDIYTLRRQINDVEYEHNQNIKALADKMRATLEEEMELHGADINTDDAKLLGFDLSEKEFVTLLNRHAENPTMQKLILKAADKQGVDLGLRFVGNEAELAELAGIEYAAAVAIKHAKNDSVFNQLFGPNSVTCQKWNVDDRQRPSMKAAIGYTDDRVANAVRLLAGPDQISEATQRDIIKEFSERPGVLAILKNAAQRGRKYEAAAMAENYISGDFKLTGDDMEQRERWAKNVKFNPLSDVVTDDNGAGDEE